MYGASENFARASGDSGIAGVIGDSCTPIERSRSMRTKSTRVFPEGEPTEHMSARAVAKVVAVIARGAVSHVASTRPNPNASVDARWSEARRLSTWDPAQYAASRASGRIPSSKFPTRDVGGNAVAALAATSTPAIPATVRVRRDSPPSSTRWTNPEPTGSASVTIMNSTWRYGMITRAAARAPKAAERTSPTNHAPDSRPWRAKSMCFRPAPHRARNAKNGRKYQRMSGESRTVVPGIRETTATVMIATMDPRATPYAAAERRRDGYRGRYRHVDRRRRRTTPARTATSTGS